MTSRWYSDGATWRLIGLRYLPWLAGLSLVWEIAQLPLYTLWTESSAGFVVFAVAHCTAGDVMIGAAALALALIVTGAQKATAWHTPRVAAATAIFGTAYTAFSEWANTVAAQHWAYSELMPTLRLSGFEIGMSPLAQWLLLPPLALILSRSRRRHLS